MKVTVDVMVRTDLAAISRVLSPAQLAAFMWGIGQVVAADAKHDGVLLATPAPPKET